MEFYDQLAADYDHMISFTDRLQKETVIFENILKRFPAGRILDAGCGTGFHSIVLSSLEREVVGIDSSRKMIQQARKNAREFKASVKFIETDFLSLAEMKEGRFDAVFCLGNSFVHLLTAKQRLLVMKYFKRSLVPGGYVFLQLINYDKILKEKSKILSVKTIEGRKYIRSYTYHASTVTFTLRIETATGSREISNEIYPLQSVELSRLAARTGLTKMNWFGNLSLHEYDRYVSENICTVLSE